MILKVKRHTYGCRAISLIVVAILVFACDVSGEQVERDIEKEIAISADSRIKIRAPQSVRISGHGTIYSRQVGDQFIVSKKSKTPHIYVIDKNLAIHSWEKSALKQESKISLACNTATQQEDLFSALAIDLRENVAGVVEVDCELNIDRFQIENGWFKTENNHVILDNGKIYPITYLKISTTLYLPTNCKVSIDSEESDISMGNHQGQLDVRLQGGKLSADNLFQLKGEMQFAEIHVDTIGRGELKINNCDLEAHSINQLELESAISKINIGQADHLVVNKSINDTYRVHLINTMRVEQSTFSNYIMRRCTGSIGAVLKNTDMDIKSLGPSLQYATIKNQNATMRIGVGGLESYILQSERFDQSKYDLPDNLTLKESHGSSRSYTLGLNPENTRIEINCALCDVIIQE